MTPFASANRSLILDERGASAVEFAMIAPILLTFVVGLLTLGMAYYDGATIQWSLERSLRAAMIHPDVTAEDIEALMAEDLVIIGSPDIDFSYEIDNSGAVPVAIVRAAYDVPMHIPFVPDLALHFVAENVAPVPPPA